MEAEAQTWNALILFAVTAFVLMLVAGYVAKRLHDAKQRLARTHAALSAEYTALNAKHVELSHENRQLFLENTQLSRQHRTLQAEVARLSAPVPRKSTEERRDERLEQQLGAVLREHVRFFTRRVMNRGELNLFYAALNVTRQPKPADPYPFYVFPQVSLGQVIAADAPQPWQADQAHRAINSKRCDLLLADRHGYPVAVLEFQGTGHDLDGTAARRDGIKRIAVEGAGIRFVEVDEAMSFTAMQKQIEAILQQHVTASDDKTKRVNPAL